MAIQTDPPRMTAERLESEYGLTIRAEFVPWSKSRSYDPKIGKDCSKKSLNWRVTLLKDGRAVLTADYTAGIGHAPSVKNWNAKTHGCKWSIHHAEFVECEAEHGFEAGFMHMPNKRKPVMPDAADVVWALVMDGAAIDCPTYEDWATEYGMDADSRKGEAVYRACLETGLRLRAALGARFEGLREAFQDF